jgi:hypothetical protein
MSDFEDDFIEDEELEEEELEDEEEQGTMFLDDDALEQPSSMKRSRSYETLSEEGVRQRTTKLVKEIQEVCNIPR